MRTLRDDLVDDLVRGCHVDRAAAERIISEAFPPAVTVGLRLPWWRRLLHLGPVR